MNKKSVVKIHTQVFGKPFIAKKIKTKTKYNVVNPASTTMNVDS